MMGMAEEAPSIRIMANLRQFNWNVEYLQCLGSRAAKVDATSSASTKIDVASVGAFRICSEPLSVLAANIMCQMFHCIQILNRIFYSRKL